MNDKHCKVSLKGGAVHMDQYIHTHTQRSKQDKGPTHTYTCTLCEHFVNGRNPALYLVMVNSNLIKGLIILVMYHA